MYRKAFGWTLLLISWPIVWLSLVCFLLLVFDCIISPVIFLWTGELASYWDPALAEAWRLGGDIFGNSDLPDTRQEPRLQTTLKGVDLLVNKCWQMQLDFYGRLKLIALGLIVGAPIAGVGLIASALELREASNYLAWPGIFLAWPTELAWCLGILNPLFGVY